MSTDSLYIIMPIKDALTMAEKAIRAIVDSGHTLTVYDDYSTPENAARLDALSQELGITILHLSDLIDHPSPNYRFVLQHAQQTALTSHRHLVIVESDVIVRPDTIDCLAKTAGTSTDIGMVAAVTHSKDDTINFPYEYALRLEKRHGKTTIPTTKRFSFCCTLLSLSLLQKVDFQTLDPTKNWYDVTISHASIAQGLQNILMLDHPVYHYPHSSRPWKQLKYTHPLRYYWRKLTQGLDRI